MKKGVKLSLIILLLILVVLLIISSFALIKNIGEKNNSRESLDRNQEYSLLNETNETIIEEYSFLNETNETIIEEYSFLNETNETAIEEKCLLDGYEKGVCVEQRTENKTEGCEQNNFKMAFVLVAKTESELTTERIEKLNEFKQQFVNEFHAATSNLAYMDTSYPLIKIIDNDWNLSAGEIGVNVPKVSKNFYQNHQDNFDFLIIYTTFQPEETIQLHFKVVNNIQGIGERIDDYSDIYGSSGKLQGINYMGFLDMYDIGDFYSYNGLLHEIGHQWCCYVGENYVKADKNAQLGILQEGIHFYAGLESSFEVGTPLGSNPWVKNNDKGYRISINSNAGNQKYHPFQLYFIGLLNKQNYNFDKKFKVFDAGLLPNNFNEQEAYPLKEISINDIIAIEGERYC